MFTYRKISSWNVKLIIITKGQRITTRLPERVHQVGQLDPVRIITKDESLCQTGEAGRC
jgi:hypothetical protein